MHAVSKIDPVTAHTPDLYRSHSAGFQCVAYVNRDVGSVHMGICYLGHSGFIEPHIHSFEETFYILENNVILSWTLNMGGGRNEAE